MLESSQILIIVVIVILTALLVVLGIQAFLTLREFRKTANTANKIMNDVKSGTNVAKIIGTAVSIFSGGKSISNIANLIFNTKEEDTKKEKSSLKSGILISAQIKKQPKVIRRFFRRSKPL